MESVALLSPTDVNTIRRYVHTKYAPLPGNRRAEIVADAIRRTLQTRLPNIPTEMKNQIVDQLITRCLVSERRDIKSDDVLDVCAELDYDDEQLRDQLMQPILSWMNERSPGRWSAEQIASRLNRGKIDSLAVIQQIAGNVELEKHRWGIHRLGWGVRQLLRNRYWTAATLGILTVVIVSAVGVAVFLNQPAVKQPVIAVTPIAIVQAPQQLPDIGMPEHLKYADIDVAALKTYLKSRDSLLVEEPYFGAIVDTAREYDINPLLLFAITGQEQGFVPKKGKDAKTIANNPFNVGHSWMDYNTDIHNSVGIASRLIVKLAKSRPEGHDPFSWFNKTYAEDPLWSDGVRKIFNKLNSLPPVP
ncbi:hypothetical protein [Cohnella sp. WQ 127256]|uniref:hypothetical protein n=1 Tax=Cohnella sp. WQ 127256 TaxID=2938790 RepID=UPI0021190E63|nr:hypothetical protein [Cohnella sp. WQ 127256]